MRVEHRIILDNDEKISYDNICGCEERYSGRLILTNKRIIFNGSCSFAESKNDDYMGFDIKLCELTLIDYPVLYYSYSSSKKSLLIQSKSSIYRLWTTGSDIEMKLFYNQLCSEIENIK